MSLPRAFTNPADYFQECVLFFQKYQHLFNFANSDILVLNILDEIDIENFENINVFDKNFDLPTERESNIFLRDFFTKLERLRAVHNSFIEVKDLESKVNVPLGPKKKHEIVYLVREIEELCEESGCHTVVDFGSGLGYLDQLLYQTTTYQVLGLECNENHYVGAKKRQRKYHTDSIDNVKYIKHLISENSHKNIEDYLKEKFGSHGAFCITGLHACADLTIDAINLFLKMADAKAMVLMPCCYHKMKIEGVTFKNFPLSSSLKEIFEKYQGIEYLKIPFLRLAAQPPCRTEDSLNDSVFNLLARAVLQLYAHKHECKLKRTKRKAVNMKTISNDFKTYIQDACNGFTLTNQSDNLGKEIKFDLEELETIWRDFSEKLTFKKAAIFVLLQNYLQPVIENFVLYDRLLYLKENGVENCRFKRIFNEKTSPRCLALLAVK